MVILTPKVTCCLWIISRLLLFLCQWPSFSKSFCFVVFTCRSNLAVGSLVTTVVVVNLYDTGDIWYYYRLSVVGYRLETLLIKQFVSYLIAGFRREVDENYTLLGYYAVLVITPYRRFETTYRSGNVRKE